MMNQPEAADLLAEARRLLKSAILPELEGTQRYEALMIANAMSIAQREAEAGPMASASATRAIDDYLSANGLQGGDAGGETLLAAAIADGRIDSTDPALETLLLELTEARLRISNPKYLAD